MLLFVAGPTPTTAGPVSVDAVERAKPIMSSGLAWRAFAGRVIPRAQQSTQVA